MRGIGLIVALLLAAAAGAAGMYYWRGSPAHSVVPGPGNGVVTCPGNASCPADNRVTQNYHGIAIPANLVAPTGPIEICTGVKKGNCPDGLVGYLVPKPAGGFPVKAFRKGL